MLRLRHRRSPYYSFSIDFPGFCKCTLPIFKRIPRADHYWHFLNFPCSWLQFSYVLLLLCDGRMCEFQSGQSKIIIDLGLGPAHFNAWNILELLPSFPDDLFSAWINYVSVSTSSDTSRIACLVQDLTDFFSTSTEVRICRSTLALVSGGGFGVDHSSRILEHWSLVAGGFGCKMTSRSRTEEIRWVDDVRQVLFFKCSNSGRHHKRTLQWLWKGPIGPVASCSTVVFQCAQNVNVSSAFQTYSISLEWLGLNLGQKRVCPKGILA